MDLSELTILVIVLDLAEITLAIVALVILLRKRQKKRKISESKGCRVAYGLPSCLASWPCD